MVTNTCGHGKKTAINKQRREAAAEANLDLTNTLTSDFQPWSCKKMFLS